MRELFVMEMAEREYTQEKWAPNIRDVYGFSTGWQINGINSICGCLNATWFV